MTEGYSKREEVRTEDRLKLDFAISVSVQFIKHVVAFSSLIKTKPAIKCPDLPKLPNGRFKATNGSMPGSIITAECDEGYSLEGLKVRVCSEWGIWTFHEQLPNCRSKLTLSHCAVAHP